MGVVGCVDLFAAGVCGECQIENLVKRSLHSFMGVDEFIHLFADRMHFSSLYLAVVAVFILITVLLVCTVDLISFFSVLK